MQVLPIIERELRVAARQPRTWYRRMGMLALAVAVLAFVVFTIGRWAGAVEIGTRVFAALSAVGFILALLAGPLTTVDCISRERREGTLGLLFLTNLRAHDVVLGKIASASLDTLLSFIGALPAVAISFLLGGVGLKQFSQMALVLFNTMFLSLALGTCFSSLTTSGRSALGLSLVTLLFLTLGLPLLGEEVLRVRMNTAAATLMYMTCPLYSLMTALRSTGVRITDFWICQAALQGLGWLCLLIACRRSSQCWRQSAEPSATAGWAGAVERWRIRARGVFARRRILERNPIAWLESRDRLEPMLLWAAFISTTAFWMYKHLQAPMSWPDGDSVIFWPLWAHYILCLWIAIQSPKRLADDRQSGALELLLCTPLQPREIIRGCMRALSWRFGTVLLALMALMLFGFYAYLHFHYSTGTQLPRDFRNLGLCGLVVFPIQAYAFMRLGLYQGLAQGNSLRATFKLIAKVGLLPWGMCIAFLLSADYLRRTFPTLVPRLSDSVVFASWTGAHLLACGVFLLHANMRLRKEFRLLAAEIPKRSRWLWRK